MRVGPYLGRAAQDSEKGGAESKRDKIERTATMK
jgi:hypothetical protein